MKSAVKRRHRLLVLVCVVLVFAAACQPTPETEAVRNKSGSLMDVISGNYDYEPENATALNGKVWSEQVYHTDKINVTVDAGIVTQDVAAYPAVRVIDDTRKFMHSGYLKSMTDFFFEGSQPYYRTTEPTRKESETKIIWLEQAFSAGRIVESRAEPANRKLEYYKKAYAQAPDEIAFDINEDPYGEKYLQKTGMDNVIVLAAYPADGLLFFEISKDHIVFSRQTSLYDTYRYEVGLSALADTPKSVQMDSAGALKIAADSVSAVAAGNDMDLVRMATINKVSTYTTEAIDYQNLEPDCLVFYFMRSYSGARSTYITPSPILLFSHSSDPDYRIGASPEYIRVVVDGLRIVEWTWVQPSSEEEVISDNVPLMPFEQIKDIFRQQVKNCYAGYDIKETRTIRIDKIELGLMKVAEKDNIEGYLVVPVWDFIGTEDTEYMGIKEDGDADYTYLTVNAIDGTVIDRGSGY